MKTSDLIKTLALDAGRRKMPLRTAWWWAVAAGIAIAALVFLMTLGVRPDMAEALASPRFLFKFLVTIALAVAAFINVRRLSQPEENWQGAVALLAVVPLIVILGALAELLILPPDLWIKAMIGENSMACLTFVLLMGLGPLSVFVRALQHAAPTSPALAGAICGMLAGGISATLYAAHCVDDSPLFVATWYTLSIMILAVLGSAVARRVVRW
jgi:hypothetical protein